MGSAQGKLLPDHRRRSQAFDRGVGQAELFTQDLVRVLAEPGYPSVTALASVDDVCRVAGHEHRLVDTVRPIDADKHATSGDVRIGDQFFGAGAGPGGDAGLAEGFAHLQAVPPGRPFLDWPDG